MWKPCTLRTCPASKSSGSRGLVTIKTTLLRHASAGVQSLGEICFTEARSATLLELYWTGVVASHTPQVDPSIEDYIYLGNPGDESPVEFFVLCEIKWGEIIRACRPWYLKKSIQRQAGIHVQKYSCLQHATGKSAGCRNDEGAHTDVVKTKPIELAIPLYIFHS